MEQRSFDAKRSRDQKRQRDRRGGGRGHHINKTEETVPIGKPNNISAVDENTRNSSSVISNKPSNEDKSKSGSVEETKEVDTAALFANLKRETDDIAALTNKKYSKRQVFSNWAKYEEQPVENEDTSTIHVVDNDFTALANAPASEGGSFKFKTEQSWDLMNIASMYGEHFALDLDILAQGLACIPFHEKLELPGNLFSADEMERIVYQAKQSSVKYEDIKKSYVKTKKKQTDDINERITSILSMKDDNVQSISQPSVYKNEEVSCQVEIKSSQSDLTFDIVAPDIENVRDSSPADNISPVDKFRKLSLTENISEPSPENIQQSSTENVQQSSTENVQQSSTENVQQSSTENFQQSSTENVYESSTAVLNKKPKEVSKKVKKDGNSDTVNRNLKSLDATVDSSNSVKLDNEIAVVANKSFSGANDNIGVLKESKRVCEDLKPSVLKSSNLTHAENKETKLSHNSPVVKTNENVSKSPNVIKLSTLISKTSSDVVKTETVKPVENKLKKKNKDVKKSTADDELDFLLSLKTPVKEVPSKLNKAKGKTTLDIEDDDDTKLPKLPPALQTEEDLDAWLDSALAD